MKPDAGKTKFIKKKDILEKVDLPSVWSQGKFKCHFCRKSFISEKFDSPIGNICKECTGRIMVALAYEENLETWPFQQFMDALDISASMLARITVLMRFREVLRIAKRKSPPDVEPLKGLLIKNLGFTGEHPLDHLARKKALDSCVHEGEEMLPVLIRECKKDPWQLYANSIVAMALIAPKNPKVLSLVEEAGKDPNPEICSRAQPLLEEMKKAGWNPLKKVQGGANVQEETILHQLGFFNPVAAVDSDGRKPPSLPTLAGTGVAQKRLPEKERNIITLKSPEEKEMETVLDSLFTADVLKRIYRVYLHGTIFNESHFAVRGQFSPHKLNKSQITQALAKVYANKGLFEAFFKALPKTVQTIVSLFVWEGGEYTVKDIERMFTIEIVRIDEKKGGNFYHYSDGDTYEAYCIFSIRKEYSWTGSLGNSYIYFISLPDELRAVFKHYLSPPKESDLIALDSIEETKFIYENQDHALTHIALYYNYIAQGNLKVSAGAGKLSKGALKRMAEYCRIKEFYEGVDDKELLYVATTLITDFLAGQNPCSTASPPEILKKFFNNFFNEHQKGKELTEYLFHLKGMYYEYQYEKREARVKQSLGKLLKDLPVLQWISLENIKKYCMYRDIDLNVMQPLHHHNDKYFNQAIKHKYGSYNERVYINKVNFKEAVIVPFLKAMMFLFAAFGVVDIAYDLPVNDMLKDRDKGYLSPFDGLRYVRLTHLGAYIAGSAKSCPVTVEKECAKALLDEKTLIITLEGKDPLLTMVVEKVADKISGNCYKTTYKTFLKECCTKKDIEQKISLFHEYIAKKPPANWKAFLEDVQNKVNPLERKDQLSVFKLAQDEELISLIAKDEVLRGCILKAENYHILVPSDSILKVKKRLEEFGYFIDKI